MMGDSSNYYYYHYYYYYYYYYYHQEYFESRFEKRVLQPLAKLEAFRARTSTTTFNTSATSTSSTDVSWGVVVDQLGSREYKHLPVDTRVVVLRFLCDEVVCTQPVRDLLETTMNAQETVKKMTPKRQVGREQ